MLGCCLLGTPVADPDDLDVMANPEVLGPFAPAGESVGASQNDQRRLPR
jgi:hypothetical protein